MAIRRVYGDQCGDKWTRWSSERLLLKFARVKLSLAKAAARTANCGRSGRREDCKLENCQRICQRIAASVWQSACQPPDPSASAAVYHPQLVIERSLQNYSTFSKSRSDCQFLILSVGYQLLFATVSRLVGRSLVWSVESRSDRVSPKRVVLSVQLTLFVPVNVQRAAASDASVQLVHRLTAKLITRLIDYWLLCRHLIDYSNYSSPRTLYMLCNREC